MDAVRRFRFRQALTISLLVLGYAGYYLCRSDFAVAIPLIVRQSQLRGISPAAVEIRFGLIASAGVLAYAIGKFPSGTLADFLGGRRNFLFGMAGAILFTLLFAFTGAFPLLMLFWCGNRLAQSLGWAGMVKITSKWFSWSAYASVMGIVSLSYLFGDAAARWFLSVLIAHGLEWRQVFIASAITLSALLIANLLLLHESPAGRGFTEPAVNPQNLFASEPDRAIPGGLGQLLRPFLRSGMFWLVCALSLGLTLVRETFNLWSPAYFTQSAGLTPAAAASASALFPLFGGVSVLAAGWFGDRVGSRGRAGIMFIGIAAAGFALAFLGARNKATPSIAITLVALIGFLTLGPYSYLAGAIALDFGGRQGSATASGLIDGVGYLGGVLAGNTIAQIAVAWGWRGAFWFLAAVCWLSSLSAAIYWRRQKGGQHEVATSGRTRTADSHAV